MCEEARVNRPQGRLVAYLHFYRICLFTLNFRSKEKKLLYVYCVSYDERFVMNKGNINLKER